jgi:hypothetical protein
VNRFVLASMLALYAAVTPTALKAQYGATYNYIKPSGSLGYYFKPASGVELNGIIGDIDEQFNMNTHLGYYSLSPTQSIFSTYARQYGGSNGLSFLPGYESWYSYQVISLGMGATYKFFDKKISPFAGLDLSVLLASYHRSYYIQTLISSDEQENNTTIAIRPKIGVSIEVSDAIRVQAGIAQSIGKTYEVSETQVYWQPFISVQAFLE